MPLPEGGPNQDDEKLRMQEVAATYRMLQIYFEQNPVGNIVRFADEHTAALDGGDPDRHCYYVGELIDLGEDDDGRPWALIQLERHAIQSVSTESVAPGHMEFLGSVFSPGRDVPVNTEAVAGHINEYLALVREYPALMEDIDLPFLQDPQIFYLDDMPACILRPPDSPTPK